MPRTTLTSRGVESCGCKRIDAITTHGQYRTPEYEAWRSIIQRCTNPNHKSWHRYGGRGITVCERWLDSFENFLEDMGKRPGPGYDIDREKNNGSYEKSNCRWVTHQVNCQNRG
jgi:hypothetical protein